MYSSTLRRILALVVLATVTSGLQIPAQADTVTVADRTGEVAAGTDILRARVTNGPRRVVVTTRHRELRRTAFGGLGIFLDTRPGRPGPEYVFFAGIGDGTDWNFSRADGWRRVGSPLRCDTRYRIDFRRDVTRASISRACLRNTGRVRVAVLASTGNGAQDWAPGRRTFSRWVARG